MPSFAPGTKSREMHKFNVILEEESRRNIDTIYEWIAQRSSAGAARWYRALLKALDRLANEAERCPVAPESHRFDETIRNLSFRMRSGRTYRILFTVIGVEAHVLYVRAPGQDLE